MKGEWIRTTIGEQVTLQRGIDITKAAQRAGSIPVISSGGISSYHDTASAKGPGVVLGRKGVVGSVYYVESDYWPHDTTLWVKDFHENVPRFVYYFFRHLAARLANMDVGSANPTLNRNHVHPMNTVWPPVNEQRTIARILGTLDDKIELNRRMNETLEQMAQAIFKSWFVDFDPVRAKAEGRGTGLPPDLAALFPDSFEDSELGEIPRNWKVQNFEQHVEAEKGLSYKGAGLSTVQGEGMPMHNLNSIYEGGGYKYEGIKYYIGEYKERHVLRAGDVIVANTEQGFDYLLIGFPAIVPKHFGDKGIFSHHIFRVRPVPASMLTTHFLYYLIMYPLVREQIIGCTNGTTVNMLSSDGLRVPRFVLPPRDLIKRFESVATPIFESIEQNYEQSVTLAAIRDALLPKLLSGEISTQKAQEALETQTQKKQP
jgi:type I restriction enzyme S subunit